MPSENFKGSAWRGLQLGALIGVSWLLTLLIGLQLDLDQLHPLVITAWVLVRSFLHTGLFILAHDAMHNSLVPDHAGINQQIGRVCLWLYAGLNYDACKRNHHRHHRMPESEADPDFCPTNNRSVLAWLSPLYAQLPQRSTTQPTGPSFSRFYCLQRNRIRASR